MDQIDDKVRQKTLSLETPVYDLDMKWAVKRQARECFCSWVDNIEVREEVKTVPREKLLIALTVLIVVPVA